MIGITSSEYWKKRFEEIEQMSNEQAVSAANATVIAFDMVLRKIEDEIRAWYSRLATNNEISYTDAMQLLSKNELAEFHWTVQEYIKYGEENAINQQWMKQLENASSKVHITKLEELRVRVQQQIETVYGKVEQITTNLLTDQYTDVAYHTAYEVQKGRNVLEQISQIEDKQVQQVLKQTWGIDEKNFSSRIWDQKDKLVNVVKQDLEQAVIRGDSPEDIISEVSKFSKDAKNAKQNASRLVMTESAVIGSKARQDTMKELNVDEYEIVATLDSKTSEICQEMDGKHFPMSEFKIGSTAPPFHVNCRTTTCPYFDDEFSDDSRTYRDEDGKTQLTDGDITYDKWKDKYVSEVENQKSKVNAETVINKKYINSKEYHEKFANLTDNAEVNERIYKCSKDMLNHRSGTLYEDMYFIDKNTGKIIASSTDMNIESAVGYNKEIKNVLKNYDMSQVIAIHNHPSGTPPSVGDFNSALQNGYCKCFTIGHDGSIIEYSKGSSPISTKEYNIRLSLERGRKGEYEAQKAVLDVFKDKYGIDYKEIAYGKK